MPLMLAKCPSCGGSLTLEDSRKSAVCPYCNSQVLVEQAINNYQITNNVTVGAGATVNVYGGANNDFEIVGGVLKKYTGAATDVTIPDNVTAIGVEVFKGHTGLKSVNIPDSVTQIGWGAFAGCTALTTVVLPDCVNILDWAFKGCTSLKNVRVSHRYSHYLRETSIGGYAFKGCENLIRLFMYRIQGDAPPTVNVLSFPAIIIIIIIGLILQKD